MLWAWACRRMTESSPCKHFIVHSLWHSRPSHPLITSIPCSQGKCRQWIEANPDKDICSPGVCLLAHLSPDQINVYDQKGAWIATLPVSLLTGLAAMARAKMWESTNFATAVRGLLHAPLHAARWCTALQSFSHYFSLPTAVMHALQNTFGLQAEWFALPIDRCMNLSSYASDRDADTLFGSLGNAYNFEWVGACFINPGLNPSSLLTAVRWAIACCYESESVLNVLLAPDFIRHSVLKASLMHYVCNA